MKASIVEEGPAELERLRHRVPGLWLNSGLGPSADALSQLPLVLADARDAGRRLQRSAPLLTSLFPELAPTKGIIESDLVVTPRLATAMGARLGGLMEGHLLVKGDHTLPVAGSVKVMGGIYAVLVHAERIAASEGLLSAAEGDPAELVSEEARRCFRRHQVLTASTDNLGLSIGIMGRALGFQVTIHMSAEAKGWKKELLRDHGAAVVEHRSDYTRACAQAREAAQQDPQAHFADDENSRHLFLGYSVAGLRLPGQLDRLGIVVDREHPMFVYLPCGVGGAPGGITFGLRSVFGDCVHCFFAEPVEAPS